MTPKITRKRVALVIAIFLLFSLGFMVLLQLFGQSSPAELKILIVTGEGLQETYGFYDVSHVSNGYTYYRDKFWTESADKWLASTRNASIMPDPTKKTHGDYSILFNFNIRYSSFFFYHRSRPYGYLAQDGDKWLYFSIMFNSTAQVNEFEIRASNFGGSSYFSTKYDNVSGYRPNEWIRFKIHMSTMMPINSPSWSDISNIFFNVQQSAPAPLQIWIDDIMITSNYHYDLALKNLRAIFKGVTLDVRNYETLPFNINEYAAIIYFDNGINATGVSIIDQYVNQGGGLVLMGLSTLWNSDGTERVDFPLSSSPVSIINTTETFIDNAGNADWFAGHPALKPWSNGALFLERGFASARPVPYLGVAEVYNVSLRADTTSLVTEREFIYEVTKQYGSGKVIYFAENMAKRIANGMLEAYLPVAHGFGGLGWAGATGDRLQLLESAVNYVSKQPLPKFLLLPFAKKGGFVFTVETSASIDFYWYLNKSCTNIVGSPSNDTAFWYIVERMKNQSEETGVTFTLLIATEQLVNESRLGHAEIEFDSKNIEALREANQSPNIEIGLSTSNIMTWGQDAASLDGSYVNMWQGIVDIRNALNVSNYDPLVWRYFGLDRRGDSMYGTQKAGLYLDVSDESGSGGVPYSDSVAVPYVTEVNTWKLQNRATFVTRVESNELLRKREETYFDWYVENDMIYVVHASDVSIAADPAHIHLDASGMKNSTSKWSQTPIFLKYVSAQRENTWVVGGVTLAEYLKKWSAAEVSTIFDSKSNTYTFTILSAPDGFTIRLPLNGKHVSGLASDVDYILKEQSDYAYLALKNPKSSETVKVTLGGTKIAGVAQEITLWAKGYSVYAIILLGRTVSPETRVLLMKSAKIRSKCIETN